MTLEKRTVVGDELEPFVVEAVDPTRIKVACAILNDPNPIHYVVEEVRRLGLGDAVINHGPLNLAYLVNVATRFAGRADRLRSFRARFLGTVYAGDHVECRGTVAALDPMHDEATLELTASVGERLVMAAEATVTVPDRG